MSVDVNSMTLAAAALWYASHGCRVFPLPPRSKAARLDGWQAKATSDPATVRDWWAKTPDANVGVLNGGPFDVLDLDGPDALAAVRDRFGDITPPVLGWVQTPRGWHGWIPTQDRRRRVGVLPHVDYLGTGGYVVAAPSTVDRTDEATGEVIAGCYRWTEPPVLDPEPVPDCTGWLGILDPTPGGAERPRTPLPAPLVAGAGTTRYGAAVLADEAAQVAATAQGGRNDRLNVAAFRVGQLVPHEIADADARHALTDAGRACGLPDAEALTTIRSGLGKGTTNPRTVEHAQRHAAAPTPQRVEAVANGNPLPEVETLPEVTESLSLADLLALDELRKLRAREKAREMFSAEKAGTLALPPLLGLVEFLAVDDPPQRYRVDGLMPTGGRVVLAAPHKAGKTTLTGNLIRCLADGDAFLDRHDTEQVARVVLVDDELDPRMLRRWLRDHSIEHPEAVDVIPLRGRLSSFDILDPATRARWAGHIGAADVLILDCLRPALDALGLSEDKDAGRFLEALDELTTAAGIAETLVIHHTGHAGDRSRGDSRILDWPDALWKLARDAEDDDGRGPAQAARYFSAYGRDVDVPQSLLGFDPATRRLFIAGGSKSDVRASAALSVVVELLAKDPDLSGRQVWDKLKDSGHTQHAIRRALALGVDTDQIRTRTGARGATLHTLNPQRVSASAVRQPAPDECVSAFYRERTHTHALDTPSESSDHNAHAPEPRIDCPECDATRDDEHKRWCSRTFTAPMVGREAVR